MSIKKATQLIGLALAAIALAAPASASGEALEWTHEHEHVVSEVEQAFEGTMKLNTPFGSITCITTMTINASTGSTAQITEFEATTVTCVGTGIFPPCILQGHTFNLPWTLHADTESLTATNDEDEIEFDYHFEKDRGCPITTLILLFEPLTFKPKLNEQGTIESINVPIQYDTSGSYWIKGTFEPELFESPTLGLT